MRQFTLLLCLTFALTALGDGQPALAPPSQPVFVVTLNEYAEGHTPEGPTAKFGDLLMLGVMAPAGAPEEAQSAGTDYWQRYYLPGQRYPLFHGGMPAGSVLVKEVKPFQCEGSVAVVEADSGLRFAKRTFAVATNAQVAPHENFRRPATAQEEQLAKRVLYDFLRTKGVDLGKDPELETEQLFATRLEAASEAVSVVATFRLVETDSWHRVLLIVTESDGQPDVELLRYGRTQDLMDAMDDLHEVFADQLDLDGDGTDEVITLLTAYESMGFFIYKRHQGRWYVVHTGGQAGC